MEVSMKPEAPQGVKTVGIWSADPGPAPSPKHTITSSRLTD